MGGKSIDEVLYADGWYDGARQPAEAVQLGSVSRFVGMKKLIQRLSIPLRNLSYYLRFAPPIGVQTRIELYEENS